MMSVAALALGMQLMVAVAEGVPTFDLNPTCSAAPTAGVRPRSREACMDQELRARDRLAERWNDIPAADRTSCVGSAMAFPSKSYVQLLTCLELAADSRQTGAPRAVGTTR